MSRVRVQARGKGQSMDQGHEVYIHSYKVFVSVACCKGRALGLPVDHTFQPMKGKGERCTVIQPVIDRWMFFSRLCVRRRERKHTAFFRSFFPGKLIKKWDKWTMLRLRAERASLNVLALACPLKMHRGNE